MQKQTQNPRCPRGTRIQTYLFDVDYWTPTTAREWLKGHGAKVPKFHTTDQYHRSRQEPPGHFKRGSMRTITLEKAMGLKAVVGCPLKKWETKPNPKKGSMTKSEAKKSLQALVDKIDRLYGSFPWLSVVSEKGKVDFVVINALDGGNKSATKKAIRDWGKKHKVQLKWWLDFEKKNPASLKKKTVSKLRKNTQIPPKFTKLTKSKINKLKKLFRVHDEAVMNPDPPPCPKCGMEYKDLKTGLDFQDVKDMLWVKDDDPEFWRYKRRHGVLGLWYEIKRGMWADHLAMCGGAPITEKQYLEHLEQFDEY